MRLIAFIAVFAGIQIQAADQYEAIQDKLQKGWNTWNTRSVTQHALLPEGFAINLAFKQHYWLEERYLRETLIGRRGENVELITPGAHALDGSYTSMVLKWETLHARIDSAHVGDDLVLLITPLEKPKSPVKLILESAMLWNRPGHLLREKDTLLAKTPNCEIKVFTTGTIEEDFYVETVTPYLPLKLDGPIGISTGKSRSIDSIRTLIDKARQEFQAKADQYGELSEAWIAVQSGIAWNTIYEPKHDRVVSTVGRLWNEEYGGYCLFGWDNFFLAYMTSLYSREFAIGNAIEHLRGATEEGFIPNDNQGNGRKSFDRSQPPVGSIMIREIYRRFPETWFLEASFAPLLEWNRWWVRKRDNEGLLAWGSHEAKNPWNETYLRSMTAACYESGMDDSPMYLDVAFNRDKNTMELQDVGLNSLYLADCKALIEIGQILGKTAEVEEIRQRVATLSKNMERLWSDDTGFYLNYHTDSDKPSHRLSPTLFYPLLADLPNKQRADRMIQEHFYNPEEFWGDYILPTIARNDPTFPKQRYWKGAIWPPTNFLTYLSLRRYGMTKAHATLSQKSLEMFLKEWRRKGYVSENYSAITGTGDDERLSSDRFHSWGALFGFMAFIEAGHMAPTEAPLSKD